MQTLPRNLTQVTSHDHYAHIYVSLLGYLVPHHHLLIQLTNLLHVHLRLHLRVLLYGKRKEKVCAEMWVHISSMTTTDRPSFQFIKVLVLRLQVGSGNETTKCLRSVIALLSLVPRPSIT